MKKLLLILLSLFVLALAGCSTASDFQNVDVAKAKELIEQGGFVVLDVRTPEEFQEGHIPGATLYPLQILEQGQFGELDKSAKYLVICRSGNRSAQASKILSENGFTEIYNINGGMNQWDGEIEKE